MKKKLLCLLSVMILVLSLAACGSNSEDNAKSDFDSFMEVQKNMQDIKDAEFKMNMDMDVAGDEDMTVKMSATGKQIADKNNPEMEMNYKMTVPGLGSNLEGTMYMTDKAVYMDIMGQKLKVDASNEMAAMMNMDTKELLSITEDMVSNLSVSKEGSDTVYTFDMDVNKALDYFQKNAGASQMMGQLDSESVTFKKVNVVVKAGEDQMIKTMDMDYAMTTKAEDQTVDMAYTISLEYLSINSGLKIDFPDFKDYQEMTV
ncbi:MAG: hypothetical protein HFE76_04890 [Firmicutes bacterium]|nr:hypothetical protein [Bacillota bacterium]